LTPPLADTAPVADLLDVFSTYDGGSIFQGLTQGLGGQPSVLGRIGWIFTAFGALFVLWGFVLRSQRGSGEDKLGEMAKTWVVIAFMVGAPFLMRAAMEAADSLYESSSGGPRNLTTACVKAAYAMPELNRLFDVLGRSALSQPQGAAGHGALISSANDGSVLGYLEAYGVALWDTASGYASEASQTWSGMVRMAAMAAGLGSAMLKCLLIAVTILPLYLLLLLAAALVWFMEQLRYFLAVSGTMMLPLFIGMYSMPEGHFSRQSAQAYVMHMVSLALWPVSWAIGHTGTIALYNALISLIAGTSRVPDMVGILQWGSVTAGPLSEAQVRTMETALGNWFMGNLAALLSILVGGLGFVLWIGVVCVMGPIFLHRMLTTGASFMAQAMKATGTHAATTGKLAFGLAQSAGLGAGLGSNGPGPGERLAGASPAEAVSLVGGMAPGQGQGRGDASMQNAARSVDDSDGKAGTRL
jgi:hypothetical protein